MTSKTISLAGEEIKVEYSGGANAWLRNDGTAAVYASGTPGISAGADGTVSIPAGQSVGVYGANGTVYLKGGGSVQLIGSDYSTNPFRNSAASGGSGADEQARAALRDHEANTDIHVTAAEKEGWNSLSNPNLLMNPDLRVNTSGKTEYHGVSSVMDCWTTAPGNTVKYLNGGARAIDDGTASFNYLLSQLVSDFAPLKGMTVTFSVKIREITGRALLQMYDGVSWPSSEVFTAPGTYHVTAVISAEATRLECNLVHGLNEAVDVTADWMKLELGGYATPFKAPVYSDEVLRIKALEGGNAASSDLAKYIGTWGSSEQYYGNQLKARILFNKFGDSRLGLTTDTDNEIRVDYATDAASVGVYTKEKIAALEARIAALEGGGT